LFGHFLSKIYLDGGFHTRQQGADALHQADMGLTLETVVFYFLAVFIIAMSILTVTTQRIVRSATYLLFVLFGTAGIYFLLGYTFLGSVQIMVYAGGIVVLATEC